MNIAICISGFLRTWEYSKPSFENIFCKDIKPDLYLHVYKQNLFEWSAGEEDTVYDEKYIRSLFSGLNVIDIVIEDLNETRTIVEKESIKYKHIPNFSTKINESSDKKTKEIELGKRIYDQFRVIYISNQLRNKSGKKYDLIVKTRYDILYHTQPNWSEMVDNKLHTETGACGGYPHDVILCGTPYVMDKIMNRYVLLDLLFSGSSTCTFCAHGTIKHLLDYFKIEIGNYICKASVIRAKNRIHIPGLGTVEYNFIN